MLGPAAPTSPEYAAIDQAMTLNALTHAVIALAIELGVPSEHTTQKGA